MLLASNQSYLFLPASPLLARKDLDIVQLLNLDCDFLENISQNWAGKCTKDPFHTS